METSANNKSKLLINGLDLAHGPVVTDDAAPTFTFMAGSQGVVATHMEVGVTGPDGGAYWHSGRQPIGTPHLQYNGKALQPKSVYHVRMTLFNKDNLADDLQAAFETGFMGSAWQAGWIEPVQQAALPEKEIKFHEIFAPGVDDGKVTERLRPCPQLKKIFEYDGPLNKARLYASAHGLYEITLNGVRVGENRLAPETSVYPRQLYYQTYDVADLMVQGQNTLEVLLADGWWAGRIGISGDSYQYGDKLGFLMQLELTDGDGQVQTICSDEQFEGRTSCIDYADLFVGERHDYIKAPGEWQPCLPAAYDMANLVAQPIAPVVDYDELEPEFFTTPKGELMADFGQVLAGVVEIGLYLPEAATLMLDFCEVLDEKGNYFRNIIGRNKNQQDVAVCPAGSNIFRPKFTYHGFRFVRITGVGQNCISRMRALAMGTGLDSRGGFSCSEDALNQLQSNIRWSTRANMLSVPTDCPQREKMGWTGDIQMFARTAGFNYDMANFLEGWLANMRLEQTPEGEIPCVVPCYPMQDKMERDNSGYNSSPAWGDACILVPLYLHQMYGGTRVLRDNLPMMEGWLSFVKNIAALKPDNWDGMTDAQKARNPYLWTKGHQFGDWLIPSLRANGHAGVQAGVQATYRVVGSCFYAVTVRAFIQVLQALSKETPADASLQGRIAEYETLLQKIRLAVQDEYITPDGHIAGDLQGMYVMALYAEIGDDALREKMAARLVGLIRENGWKLDTGFVSVPYLMDVLTDAGQHEAAFRLLLQTECPSWLYMVFSGATTMWENWAAIRPDGEVTNSSFNHYALGCVGDWMYRRVAGIAPVAPGYAKVRFAPLFHIPLEGAGATHDSLYGRITSYWQKEDGAIRYEVNLPLGATGEAVLPIPDTASLLGYEGPQPLASLKASFRNRDTILQLDAGSYRFTFKDPSTNQP